MGGEVGGGGLMWQARRYRSPRWIMGWVRVPYVFGAPLAFFQLSFEVNKEKKEKLLWNLSSSCHSLIFL